jgi:hypothetical protein
MAYDARLQKLIEGRIKPAFDKFNIAVSNLSLSMNDLSFELDENRRDKARNTVSKALREIENKNK